MTTQPEEAEIVVIGAGTGGATCAGLLAEHSSRQIVLLEAGPDYGSFDSGSWPQELLDARFIPLSHDWGLKSVPDGDRGALDLARARVMGGCSSHNGCTNAPGPAIDYDSWSAAVGGGWDGETVKPLLELVLQRMRASTYSRDELTEPQAAFVDAGVECGLPYATNLIETEAGVGIGPMAANVVDGVRWNSGFAFIDPVRGRSNLRIVDRAQAHRVVVTDGRVAGVEVEREGEVFTIHSETVIVCGGAYGTPALLLRSGIGPASDLLAHGLGVNVNLAGVGKNLLDHPCVVLNFAGGPAVDAHRASTSWLPDEQSVGRAVSDRCDDGPYDIHVFMVAGSHSGHHELPPVSLYGSAVRARSQGSVRLTSDPMTPAIDHAYLSDPDGHDVAVLEEARGLLYAMTQKPELAAALGECVNDGSNFRREVATYCHPAGTCKMGLDADPTAVTDADGAVHGLTGLYVADASLMPEITRANPNVPVAMMAAKVAAGLLGLDPGLLAARTSPGGDTGARVRVPRQVPADAR